MTEQQEFLEHLKDPVHANLLKACKEFQAARYQSIKDIKILRADDGGYTIRIFAENGAALKVAEHAFVNLLRKCFTKALINVVTDMSIRIDGDSVRTFYVTEGAALSPLVA